MKKIDRKVNFVQKYFDKHDKATLKDAHQATKNKYGKGMSLTKIAAIRNGEVTVSNEEETNDERVYPVSSTKVDPAPMSLEDAADLDLDDAEDEIKELSLEIMKRMKNSDVVGVAISNEDGKYELILKVRTIENRKHSLD